MDWETLSDEERLNMFVLATREAEWRIATIRKQADRMTIDEQRKIDHLRFVHETWAENYVRTVLSEKRARHIKTPWGDIGLRRIPASITVKWPSRLPDEYKTDGVPDQRKINRAFKDNPDTIIPGCEIVMGRDKLYITGKDVDPDTAKEPEDDNPEV